jgi:hypothetical protein
METESPVKHYVSLPVTCPLCGRTKELVPSRRNATNFVPESCDGVFGKRHGVRVMLGPLGRVDA